MRILASALFIAVAAWLGGFFLYVESLPRAAQFGADEPPPPSDGVVALTGDGGARIATAMDLLQAGVAPRLLISGVHAHATDADLMTFWAGEPEGFACCVDVGRIATSTRGNAREIVDWARERGYHRLIVVTTDNHMPRSFIEIHALAPDLELTPWPVPSVAAPERGWIASPKAWRVLSIEYSKFLVAAARSRFASVAG